MNQKVYEYDTKIICTPDNGGAYVVFPWNVREEFGKGRVKVSASVLTRLYLAEFRRIFF